eukprot:TRINITY_DN74351_c0_g1_i1.p1 TRINITY_DN74351_c0_g1~~TRINITY_DN74351_c0_g1_i1.p1  ORF type:complete len:378 (-),score=102.15 TRINITY_DN74351_c0_g1_i1:37-1170(-)
MRLQVASQCTPAPWLRIRGFAVTPRLPQHRSPSGVQLERQQSTAEGSRSAAASSAKPGLDTPAAAAASVAAAAWLRASAASPKAAAAAARTAAAAAYAAVAEAEKLEAAWRGSLGARHRRWAQLQNDKQSADLEPAAVAQPGTEAASSSSRSSSSTSPAPRQDEAASSQGPAAQTAALVTEGAMLQQVMGSLEDSRAGVGGALPPQPQETAASGRVSDQDPPAAGAEEEVPDWLFEDCPVWLTALQRFLQNPDVLVVYVGQGTSSSNLSLPLEGGTRGLPFEEMGLPLANGHLRRWVREGGGAAVGPGGEASSQEAEADIHSERLPRRPLAVVGDTAEEAARAVELLRQEGYAEATNLNTRAFLMRILAEPLEPASE